MEDISVLQRPVTSTFNNVRTKISSETFKNTLSPNNLVGEVDENFINYLNWHGLANEDNLLVLSSKLHYYYDYEELREVKTLINLKKINLIKHLDDFLHILCYGLSPKANFIGCFSDIKTQKGVSLISRLYKKFINFLDSKIEVDIDSKDFSKLLESYGFKIIDMTEINGLTYFRSQNYRRSNI
ncbi:MAG: hypothetical protein WA816_04625 [Bacteroidales bacterium]